MKRESYLKRLMDSYKKNKKTFILLMVLHAMVILTAIRCLVTKNYESFATCILVLLLFLVPALIEDKMKLSIPPLFQAIIFAFIFAAEILGEVDNYYTKIPGWDTILHTLNGFLFAAVGFSTIYLLNRGSKDFKLSPLYLSMVAFCFSMTIGVVWEFFECSMDLFFNKDMQKDFLVQTINTVSLNDAGELEHINDVTDTVVNTSSGESVTIDGGYLDIGILDTMKDLLVNLIGAVVFSTFGYIALKTSKSNKVVDNLMIRPNDIDDFSTRPKDPYYISPEDKETILETLKYWEGKSMEDLSDSIMPEKIKELESDDIICVGLENGVSGETTCDHEKILRVGMRGYILDYAVAQLPYIGIVSAITFPAYLAAGFIM